MTIQIEYNPDLPKLQEGSVIKIYCLAMELIGNDLILDLGTTVLDVRKVISVRFV